MNFLPHVPTGLNHFHSHCLLCHTFHPAAPGNLFVADAQSDIIWRIDSTTARISTIVGNATLSPWWSEDGWIQYSPPSGDNGPPASAWLSNDLRIVMGPTDMYVADTGNFAVRKVTNFAILR